MSKVVTLFLAFFLGITHSFPQTQISGVVNDYTEVNSFDPCANSINVASATDFAVGDRVVLIQMKGADIANSNNSNFGTITQYNDAGHYEFGTISAISGNDITLQNTIMRSYDPAGAVQLVRVAVYTCLLYTSPSPRDIR